MLFYCDECAAERGYPPSDDLTEGQCYICHTDAPCNAMDSVEMDKLKAERRARVRAFREGGVRAMARASMLPTDLQTLDAAMARARERLGEPEQFDPLKGFNSVGDVTAVIPR